jgi:hypothetical protein
MNVTNGSTLFAPSSSYNSHLSFDYSQPLQIKTLSLSKAKRKQIKAQTRGV